MQYNVCDFMTYIRVKQDSRASNGCWLYDDTATFGIAVIAQICQLTDTREWDLKLKWYSIKSSTNVIKPQEQVVQAGKPIEDYPKHIIIYPIYNKKNLHYSSLIMQEAELQSCKPPASLQNKV